MHKVVIPMPDEQVCFACHAGVDRIAAQEIAKNAIVGVCRQAPDHVAWIDIFGGDADTFGFEIRYNGFLEIYSDIFEFDIAGGIAFGFLLFKKFLAGTFGDNNNRMPSVRQPLP
jgi:hypothetical protein